jgi:spore maturation protein CgeB
VRVALFYHSLLSCWNHGNAHFLRGIASELLARGHEVRVFEPADGWSLANLRADGGGQALEEFATVYPGLTSHAYRADRLDLDAALDGIDLVLVHEWNDHALVARLGAHRAAGRGYRLLFHDTHHRSLSREADIAAYDLRHYDGVLAFGEVVRRRYLDNGWTQHAWTWHEAADTRVFRPLAGRPLDGDLVWIGNWGDDERAAELGEFLFDPVADLRLQARVFGVRYPREALTRLEQAGIAYGGWLPNFKVPELFARHRVTVHVPRRPYVEALPGIPTIRPFEALACAIPLISAPWQDSEGLFTPGRDFLVARDGAEMRRHLRDLLHDEAMAAELALHGHRTLLARHTCAHRVDELITVCHVLGVPAALRNEPGAPPMNARARECP